MIVINVKGGLGNQLFQAAFGLWLERNLNADVKYAVHSYVGYSYGHKFLLNSWNSSLSREIYDFKKDSRKFILIREPEITFKVESLLTLIETNICKGNNIFLDGYWNNIIYYAQVQEDVRHFFTPSGIAKETTSLAREIREDVTVGLHIRRADYGHHGLVKLAYYTSCIEEIRNERGDARVIVFSDEYNFSKFQFGKMPRVEVRQPNVKDPREDFYLLTQCTHFILANSTFSFWAGLIGEKSESIVFFPEPFCIFKDIKMFNSSQLNWRVIPNSVLHP